MTAVALFAGLVFGFCCERCLVLCLVSVLCLCSVLRLWSVLDLCAVLGLCHLVSLACCPGSVRPRCQVPSGPPKTASHCRSSPRNSQPEDSHHPQEGCPTRQEQKQGDMVLTSLGGESRQTRWF